MESDIAKFLAAFVWHIVAGVIVFASGIVISWLFHRPQIRKLKAQAEEMKDTLEEHRTEIEKLQAESRETESGEVPFKGTITEHGIVTLGETGRPERFTSWDKLKLRERVPQPSSPAPKKPD